MQCFLLFRQNYGQCGPGKLNMTYQSLVLIYISQCVFILVQQGLCPFLLVHIYNPHRSLNEISSK